MGKKKRQEFQPISLDKTKDQEGAKFCCHINKSVVLGRLKPKRNIKLQQKRLAVLDSSAAEDKEPLWICLKCGQFDCGHRQHTENKPPALHCISFNIAAQNSWCNICKIAVEVKDHQKLNKAIQLLQQYLDEVSEEYETARVEHEPEEVEDMKRVVPSSGNPPRGLKNLGNTCYFNVVLQCLARTPNFISQLEKLKEETVVPVDENLFKGDSEKMSGVTLKIDRWMSFSELLLKALEELNMPERKPYVPVKLLSEVYRMSNTITKDEQHDAHELLRELLQKMKEMDYERFKSAFFKTFKSPKPNKEKMDDTVHQMIKNYEKHTKQKFFLEDIFGGMLVSVLKCQECGNTSYTNESFMDLSLPIVDKMVSSFETNWNKSSQKTKKNDSKHYKNLENAIAAERMEDSMKHFESELCDADIEDNIEQDGRGSWVGESGYDSEFPVPSGTIKEGCVSSDADNMMNTAEENNCESTGSPLSDRDTPSPVSSEMNIDCSRMHAGCNSPVSPEYNGYRPVSRFAFCDDVENVRCSPVNEMSLKAAMNVMDLKPSDDDQSSEILNASNETLCNDSECLATPDKLESSLSALMNESSIFEVNETQIVEDLKQLKLNDGDNTAFIVSQNQSSAKGGSESTQEYDASRFTLTCCLNNFTAVELMTDSERVACSKCTERNEKGDTVLTISTKQIWIKTLPAVLILHLKRFEVKADGKSKGRRNARPKKLNRHIQFPVVLDVAPYIFTENKELNSKKKQKEMYSLYAVIEHKGSINQGHYIVHVKCKADASQMRDVNGNECEKGGGAMQWFSISDDMVHKVEEKDVLKSQAYILFYEKC